MAVTERFVASMITEMIKQVPSYIKSLRNWQRDVEDHVKELRLALVENLAMVTAAQRQYTGDNTLVDQWVLQIKDAIYDAEYVLDEFEYRGLKARADRGGSTVSRTFSHSLTLGKRLIGLDDFRTTLEKMLQRLNRVGDSVKSLSQEVHLERGSKVQKTEVDPTRVTSSIEPAHKIFGRDKEREEIVTMLLKLEDEPESSSSRKPIPVIPIVGHGGLGKTTLARLVYNDSRIVDHFSIRIWVCVSDSFDKIRLTKDILESISKADEKFEDINNFQKLQKSLLAKLESKKLLLVLDDVWFNEKMKDWENKESWDQVLGSLNQVAIGSKILVTTRNDMIANMFDATNRIPLKGLANGEYWSMFKSCAFGNAIPENHQELEAIGRKIVEKLHGSPLAAKAIGALLRDKLDVNEWEEILENDISDNIGSILNLSYQRLPDHLKLCFRYCSIFPKDWKFESEKLVFLWIAQGYVQTSIRDQRQITDDRKEYFNQMISRGKEYFNQLLFRSFFQEVKENFDTYYVMHDLMHDLSQFVSIDDCFRINNGKMSTITKTVRHLSIVVNNEPELEDILSGLEKMSNLNKLHTLMIFGNRWIKIPKHSLSVFKDLRSLRVLDFGELKLEELSGVLDHLLHLRYLNLSCGGSVMLPNPSLELPNPSLELPKSLPELYQLQVLVTRRELQFSRSMARLIKFGRLACLDARPIVYYVEKERGHKICVLGDPKIELQGKLCIKNLENISYQEDAIRADLRSKQNLDGLVLWWNFWGGMNRRDTDKEVAEGLKPHQNLRNLKIYGFRGTRSPSWLETNLLISLTTIELSNCGCLEVLPPLGQLPCLHSLHINGMSAIERVTSEFYGHQNAEKKGFPSLKFLRFELMPGWLEWSGVEEFPIFPCLQSLTVKRSPKLMRFPVLPPTLSEICIEDIGLISSLHWRTKSSSSCEDYFRLTDISVIPSNELLRALLPDELLRAIDHLEIRDSKGHMPAGGIVELAALKKLKIVSCLELLASEEEDGPGVLPSSLESLSFGECHVTDRWLSRCLQGLTSLSELEIWGCTGLTSLRSAQVLQPPLTALQRLSITHCRELTSLGGLSALGALKDLTLHYCRELKSLPEEGLPASLEKVHFCGCGVPRESLLRCLQGLASLSELTVDFCPDLTSFTSLRHLGARDLWPEADSELQLPQSLESLSINNCGVSDAWLSTCLQGLASLSELKICDCTHLTSLPSAHVLRSLTRLRKLEIWFCEELTSLGGLHALESLTHLKVSFCSDLKSLPKEGLPHSVQHLSLEECDLALMRQMEKKKGPEWDKVAHIPHVEIS